MVQIWIEKKTWCFNSLHVNRNRAKNGAMEAKVLAVMIAKILCDSCGRLIVFSTCMYYIGSGNFSTLYTLLWFYSMVATLIVFYSIFNEDRIFSIGNIIGDDNSCWFKTNLIPFFQGICLNSYASVITFSNWDVPDMLEVIVKGKGARKKKKLHQASITKQFVYNVLIFGGYFG